MTREQFYEYMDAQWEKDFGDLREAFFAVGATWLGAREEGEGVSKARFYSYDAATNMVTCLTCHEKFVRQGVASYDAHVRVCIDVPPLADDYDGMDVPACGHSLVGARELTEWMVREGWRTSKQELVERLLKDYDVVRKA